MSITAIPESLHIEAGSLEPRRPREGNRPAGSLERPHPCRNRRISSLLSIGLIFAYGPLAALQVSAAATQSRDSKLQDFYDAAQRFQKAGKFDQAAEQFRTFLANATGELATDYSKLGDYPKASPLFDESLALEPNAPQLRLDYAQTALLEGDLPLAEKLAKATVQDFSSNDSKHLAEAHQILGRTLLKMNQDKDARKELETAVALDPSFANGYDLAVTCLDLDDEKCAVQLFTEMQASFGDTPAIYMAFGRAYGNSDYAPRAVTEFKKVIAEDPRFPGAHYCLAAALLTTGQDDATVRAAEVELKKELEVSPRDFLTYSALGKIAETHSRYAEAERYLTRATQLNPSNPDAFLYLGQMYYDTNRSADAERALRHAIELTTDVSRNRYQIQKAHFLLGRILVQQHKQNEARAEMEVARSLANKVLARDKSELAGLLANDPGAQNSADEAKGPAASLQAPQENESSTAFRELTSFEKRLSPAIADSYNNLGAITASRKDYSDALRYFTRAAAWNPTLDGLDYNMGRAAFMASQFSEAVAPLSRYITTHPQDSGIRAALAMSEFMTHNYGGCIDALKGVEATIATIPQMQYIYADSLVKTGQSAEGIRRLISLEATHPEIAEVHRGLGEAFDLQGERERAAKELQNAVQLNAKDAEAHYDLGKVELESGNAASAIAELQSAIQLAPNEPGFHQELAQAYKLARQPAEAAKELKVYDDLQKKRQPVADSTSKEDKNP